MKVMVIKIKLYQSKNTLIKLKHTWEILYVISKRSDTWKVKLAKAINFVSFKDSDEEHEMHSESDNIEFMITIDHGNGLWD